MHRGSPVASPVKSPAASSGMSSPLSIERISYASSRSQLAMYMSGRLFGSGSRLTRQVPTDTSSGSNATRDESVELAEADGEVEGDVLAEVVTPSPFGPREMLGAYFVMAHQAP